MASAGALLSLLRVPLRILLQAAVCLLIIFRGLSLTFGFNGLGAILKAPGDSKTPLYVLTISTLLNIVLGCWTRKYLVER